MVDQPVAVFLEAVECVLDGLVDRLLDVHAHLLDLVYAPDIHIIHKINLLQ